jgi:GNAT superfamily N-acetyltransferase
MPADFSLLIRDAGRWDIGALVEAVTPALAERPLARHVQPHHQARERGLRLRLRTLIAEHAGAGTVRLAEIDGQPVGCSVWTTCAPNGQPADGLLAALLGVAADDRHARALRGQLAQRHPRPAHEHLLLLAVRPDQQRHGIAGALLDDWHSRPSSVPARFVFGPSRLLPLMRQAGYRSFGVPLTPAVSGPTWHPQWRPGAGPGIPAEDSGPGQRAGTLA